MKKISLILFGLIILISGLVYGEVVATFDELSRPIFVAADDTQLYISEDTSVYIYSLKDFKLIKKFGKAGEGPSEFVRFAIAMPIKDKILVNTTGKVVYFSKKGDFVSEAKTKAGFNFIFMPVKNDFIGLGFTQDKKENAFYRTINIYDKDLNKNKTLFKKKMDFRRDKINPFDSNEQIPFQVWKDIIYVLDDKNAINICKPDGKIIRTIKPEYKTMAVSQEDKDGMMEFYKTDPRMKQFYDRLKNRIAFPKNLPNLRNFIAVDDKIYIITYKQENDKNEFIIYDKNGKLLKRDMFFCKLTNPKSTYPLNISNNKIYQLVENEDEEVWELHINEIK